MCENLYDFPVKAHKLAELSAQGAQQFEPFYKSFFAAKCSAYTGMHLLTAYFPFVFFPCAGGCIPRYSPRCAYNFARQKTEEKKRDAAAHRFGIPQIFIL